MKIGSLFSGCGGFDEGFVRAGMKLAWQCENDERCLEVLRYHYPDTPTTEDVREINVRAVKPVDLVCGGFPCQDLSVAGRRAGLAGERSGLFHEFMRYLGECRPPPRWVVIENVPGLLSSNRGRDMGTVLTALEERGYGWAYRVLDSQFFGVPQRRRRVFIVGHFGDWRFAAKVLFESESVRGDSPQGGEAGEGVAKATGDGTYLGNAEGGARSKPFLTGSNHCRCVNNQTPLIKILKPHIVNDRPAEFKWAGDISHGLRATDYKSLPVAFAQNQRGELRTSDVSPQLTTGGGKPGEGYPAVAFTHSGYSNKPAWITGQRTDCLPAGGQHPSSHQGIGVMEGMSVRRLTPRECERLQGFPDDWTRWGIDRKGNLKELADGPRYRMLGNAVTVNVSEWIGKRIMEAEKCES